MVTRAEASKGKLKTGISKFYVYLYQQKEIMANTRLHKELLEQPLLHGEALYCLNLT